MFHRRLACLPLLACAALAQVAPPAPPPGPPASGADPNATVPVKPEELCKLEGTIYSLKTGQPLNKAEIHLNAADRSQKNGYAASTDAAGQYVLENLPAGKYDLAASRNGYVRTSYGIGAKKHATTIITLSPGQHMTKVDIELPPQAIITGRVVDEDNEPMSNITVELMRRGYQNGKPMVWPGERSTTNDKGEYRIFGVGPGKYWAMAQAGGTYMMMEQREIRSTKSGHASYAPTYYPGGLSLAEGAQLQIAAGTELDGIDFHMLKVKSFTVSGKFLNAGTTRLAVQLTPHDTEGSPGWERSKMSMVDKEGKFFFTGVAPGRYDLSASQFSPENRKSAHAEVIVANGDVEVPLTFGDSVEVRGVVRSDDPSDIIKEVMNVFLQPEIPNMMGGASGETKEDGSFTLKGVQPDSFRLHLFPVPEGHYVKSIQVGANVQDDTALDLTNGIPGELVITLSAKGATISGTLQDDQQKPVTSGTVVLVPDDRKVQSRYETANPDQNGQFTLKSVRPGSYKLFAFDNVESGSWLDPEFLKAFETKGESIEVKELEKATRNLVVILNDEQ